MTEISEMIDAHWKFLRDNTVVRTLNSGTTQISTPFLDRHNDSIQIYVKRQPDGTFQLHDDGYTINDLAISGCSLDTPKRQHLLREATLGRGVKVENTVLSIDADTESFGSRKHNLIQAMLAVNDLFYVMESGRDVVFLEEVADWLDSRSVRFSKKVKFAGKSGYDHVFDFLIPKSMKYPERFVQTMSRPSKDSAGQLAFQWVDTKDAREDRTLAFALLNDSEHRIGRNVVAALTKYDIRPILWSQREEHVELLVA